MINYDEVTEKAGGNILDFSVNTNPLGMPATVSGLEKYQKLNEFYPDSECTLLRQKLSEKYLVNAENILCGNGADDIIYRLPIAICPKSALIAAPTYEDYSRSLAVIDCGISYYIYKQENGYKFDTDIYSAVNSNIVYICNPNNPTGELIKKEYIDRLAEACQKKGAYLVVDESFMSFIANEKESVKNLIYKYKNLIVIDAFTKSYCMPGFRLGFCMCSDGALLEKIKSSGQSSSVSAYAQIAGIMALQDKDYLSKTIEYISSERKYLINGLKKSGVFVYSSDTNFILIKSPNRGFRKMLLKNGIKVRNCDDFIGLTEEHIRIAVKKHADNECLLEIIKNIMK